MADKPKDKEDEDFIIPEKFIKQLEEFCNGGFILLTFSSKGNPVVHHHYETKKDQLALEASLFMYADKLESAKFESNNKKKDEDDDDDDDEEEKED